MKYLQKTWIRIIVSLLVGGFGSELIHISTGDPNRPTTSGESYLVILIAIITFVILTSIVKKNT